MFKNIHCYLLLLVRVRGLVLLSAPSWGWWDAICRAGKRKCSLDLVTGNLREAGLWFSRQSIVVEGDEEDAFCQGKAVKIYSSDALCGMPQKRPHRLNCRQGATSQVRETPSCESLLDIRSGPLCTFNSFAIVFICTCDR